MTQLTETPHTHFAASAFAPQPAEERGLARDEVRLLVGTPDGLSHERFRDLPDHLAAGDVLVVNTSATIAARGRRRAATARPVVLHVAHHLDDGDRVVELRTAPDAARAFLDRRAGDEIRVGDVRLILREPWPGAASSPTGVGNRLWRATCAAATSTASSTGTAGRSPTATSTAATRWSSYQTVFGRHPGSAEMASAGRPFTDALVTRLVTAGVQLAPVTLHTGVSSQEAGEAPGPEWFEVPPTSARIINGARANGGRVIAVGTTATRAVESAVNGRHVVATAAGPTGSSPRRPRRRSSTDWSPAGTTRWRHTCSSSRRSRASASHRRRTTLRWPRATSGTSSATRRC